MTLIPPILIPAIVAGLIWLVSWRLWNRARPAEHGHWGGAPALALAYAAAHILLVSWPARPPVSARDWLFYLALAAMIVCAAERVWTRRLWTAAPVRFLLIATFLWFQFSSLREHTWSVIESLSWIAGTALIATLVWDLLDRLAQRQPGVMIPAVLWLTAAATAATMVLGATALLGQLTGGVAAALGAAVVLALWCPQLSLAHGAAGLYVLLTTSLIAQAYFYAELPLEAAVLLLLAPLAAWIAQHPALRTAPLKSTAAALAATAVPLALAIYFAWTVYAQNQQAAGDYYSY